MVETRIRLLLKEQSDQSLHHLLFQWSLHKPPISQDLKDTTSTPSAATLNVCGSL